MSEQNKCFMCSQTSFDRTLIKIEEKGEDKYVCADCMPKVIHGENK
jgi:hypothetical protein